MPESNSESIIDETKISQVINYLTTLQNNICDNFIKQDPSVKLQEDLWEKNNINGRTKTFKSGQVIEKAGVSFSKITGNNLPQAASKRRPELVGAKFTAMGVSVVVHPQNPFVPVSHMNVRCFIAETKNQSHAWWFGGGFDLTPCYPFMEDCQHWHQTAYELCKPFGDDIYPKYKKWCDEYFYIKHRQEPRGIGGLFFDDLNHWEFDKCLEFIKAVGNGYIAAYIPIVNKRKNIKFTEQEKQFQLYRRGRYVEFNLVYDRGTLFGLQSNGRAESILMSLPPNVTWQYNWQPEPGSKEAELSEKYLIAQEWI